MATASEIDKGLDEIAAALAEQTAVLRKSQTNASGASSVLAALPTDFAAVIAAIQAFDPATTNELERLQIARLAAYTTEFQSKITAADAIVAVTVD